MTATAVRVGTDIESIDAVADAIRSLGQRYLDEVFTEQEIDASGGPSAESAPGLAARFAAKEAALKVLRVSPFELRSIEICQTTGGWCRLNLTGSAAATAAKYGLHSFEVSLSHGAGVATATVVALVDEGAVS